MESLYLLIPVSVLLVFVIGGVFWWSVRSGQFDDLEGPGFRVLQNDDRLAPPDSSLPSADTSSVTQVNDAPVNALDDGKKI
jgi:cbb3-type cytochrome oxidase maturation protein